MSSPAPALPLSSAKRMTQLPPAEFRLGMLRVIEYRRRPPNTCCSSGLGLSMTSTFGGWAEADAAAALVFGEAGAAIIVRPGPPDPAAGFAPPALAGGSEAAPTCKPGGAPWVEPDPTPLP